jgi:hypothetical protein
MIEDFVHEWLCFNLPRVMYVSSKMSGSDSL